MPKLILFTFILAFTLSVYSEAPDSFEVWGLLKPTSKGFFDLHLKRQDPLWLDAYSTASIKAGWGQKHHHMIAAENSYNTSDRRQAYTYNYNFQYAEHHSLYFKYIHEDLYFIDSGKESIGLGFNSFWGTQNRYGVYFSLGAFQRWLKQRWDRDQHLPFTFSTDDVETFLTMIWGLRLPLWQGSKKSMTIDFNNQDTFHFYSGDNWATDFKFYFPLSDNFSITILAGCRYTGITGLVPNPAEYYGILGFLMN